MATVNYQKSYSILGVFQDDDWETVRSAYKQQIRRWHPDRFQDPDQRRIAEDKCKEINLAFQGLDEYYQQYGVLPPEDDSKPNGSVFSENSPPGPDSHTGMEPESFSATEDNRQPSESIRQPGRRSYAGILLAVTAVVAGYMLSEPLFDDHHGTTQAELAGMNGGRSVADSYKANMDESPAPHANAAPQEEPVPEWPADAGGSPHQSSHPAAPARLTYITRGSTKQEVLAIQGRPLRETENAWDYGLSRINFQNGKVTDWYENPMNPLIVQR